MTAHEVATERQIEYLRSLARSHDIYGDGTSMEGTVARVNAAILSGFTRAGISETLDVAYRAPRWPADQVSATPRQVEKIRWLAGNWAIYGLNLNPEETVARLETEIASGLSLEGFRLLNRLVSTAKPYPTARSPLPLRMIEGIDDLSVHEGHYAVLIEGVLRFYRVYTPDTGEHADQQVIRRYASEALLGLYPDEARAAVVAIDSDRDAAAFRFSDEFTRCSVCGKTLTDAVSRLLSVGPTCRGFTGHTGIRQAAADVDSDPVRRAVYRALRVWALAAGFNDPASSAQRVSMMGQMTASRLASAWSGLPGVLDLAPATVVGLVEQATTGGELPDILRVALLEGPTDTVLILISSGVLSSPVLNTLTAHSSRKVRDASGEFFLSSLGG